MVARLSDFEYFACMHTSSVIVHTLPTPRDSCAYSSFCALTKAIDPRFLKHSQDKLHSLFVIVNYLYCVYIFTVFETLCVTSYFCRMCHINWTELKSVTVDIAAGPFHLMCKEIWNYDFNTMTCDYNFLSIFFVKKPKI